MAKKKKLADVYREQWLNRIITKSLWAPRGDPSWDECMTAAEAYRALKDGGFAVQAENEVISVLRTDNVHEHDFLASVGM